MDWAVVPPSWSFDLKRPSTGLYRLWGGARSWHQHGDSSPQIFSGASATNVLIPRVSHGNLHPHPRDLLGTTGCSDPGPSGVIALKQVPVHMKHCVHPPGVESVSSVLLSSPTGLHSQLRGVPYQCQSPRLGRVTLDSERLWKNCNIIILQFVVLCRPYGA